MSKTLIAYFSAEHGTTRALAEKLASATGADLFEIVPRQPYTKADLNWNNPVSRCNREQIAKKDVAVDGEVENMDDYDLLLLGFPIWYYNAPMIVKSFVKNYDLAGKKVALFATSGGSDIGKTAPKLQPYLGDGATIVDAKVFNGPVTEADLKNWVESL